MQNVSMPDGIDRFILTLISITPDEILLSIDRMLAPVAHAIAGRIPFDALLIGRGHRTCEGLVHIDDILHLQGLPASFVAEYDAVARHDSVAQFFLDCPWEPQAVSTADYAPAEPDAASLSPAGRRASADLSRAIVHDYLVRHGIRHFMLAGLESSYGLAWATLYRLTDDTPFSSAECERAKFELPGPLHRWQEAHLPRTVSQDHAGLTPLTRRELDVCLRNVRGQAPKTIAADLHLSVHYIREIIQNARRKLGIAGRKMTLQDLARRQEGG